MNTILTQIPSRKALKEGLGSLEIGYPWITPGAIISLESLLRPSMSVIELGSGGSTVFFASRCRHVTAIETDPEWYVKTAKALESKTNVTLLPIAFDDLPAYLRSLADHTFDIGMVDHKNPKAVRRHNRLPGAIALEQKIKSEGWMIIDNYASFGMEHFPYLYWEHLTFDDPGWSGRGTRICRKVI